MDNKYKKNNNNNGEKRIRGVREMHGKWDENLVLRLFLGIYSPFFYLVLNIKLNEIKYVS